jgi:hypothetical protein
MQLMKKRIILITAVLAAGTGLASAALNAPQTTGADTSPLIQQVEHQGEQLSNHEARITNTENDVKDIQAATSTPPSVVRVPVPVPNPLPPAPAQVPVPVTVTSFEQVLNGINTDCKLNYSDGSSVQRQWKIVDSDGNVSISHTVSICDSSLIGQRQ